MQWITLVLPLLFGVTFGAQNLFTIQESASTEGIIDCDGDAVLTCQKIVVHFDAFNTTSMDLSLDEFNITFTTMSLVDETKDFISYAYENDDDDEATFTISDDGATLTGDIVLPSNSGREFMIVNCGDDCHVLIEEDLSALPAESAGGELSGVESRMEGTPEMKKLLNRGLLDRQSIVTITVKVYYTPQFAAGTTNIRGFIQNAINQMNTGLINSHIYIRMQLWCIEQSTVNDMHLGSALTAFDSSKGTLANLRGGADMAALLTNQAIAYCGIAWLRSFFSGRTTSVTAKPCIPGHTFSHELGHNFGAGHNREVSNNGVYPYSFGYHITYQGNPSGWRTIMAYFGVGHETRINYWSNDMTWNGGCIIMGDANNNNRRVLNDNRFAMAGVGNEAFGQC